MRWPTRHRVPVVVAAVGMSILATGAAVAQPGFSPSPAWTIPGTAATRALALGDVDGDGDLDLVLGNLYTTPPLLYLNRGAIEPLRVDFTTNVHLTRAMALGDIDGDGDLDLVCGNRDLPNTLYRNDGGAFAPDSVWSSGPAHHNRSVALGDVDGDGDLDLVCGNGGPLLTTPGNPADVHPNTMYRNVGGTFTREPAWLSADSLWTQGITLGDVDGDGDLDLVCANVDAPNTLHLNVGGTFSDLPVWTAAVELESQSVVMGDVDRDGDLDLVCGGTNLADQPFAMFENVGGTFTATPVWTSVDVFNGWAVALADVEGDGDLDLLAALSGVGSPLQFGGFENTSPAFSPSPIWSTQSTTNLNTDVVLDDVDRDGDLDLALSSWGPPAELYLNAGGVFSPTPDWTSFENNQTYSIALGRVDLDNDLDIVCGNYFRRNTVYEFPNGSPYTFGPDGPDPESQTYEITLGDVDGDGNLDAVCGNESGSTLHLNTGSRISVFTAWRSAGAWRNRSVALGDVDNDGDPDLVCGNVNQETTLFENTGSTFEDDPKWKGSVDYAPDVELGDVNGDGYPDLVYASPALNNKLYLNVGGTFANTPAWSSGLGTTDVALGDVDGDGDLDLVCGNPNATTGNTMFENIGGTFDLTPAWMSGTPLQTVAVALGDVDGDGDLDLACGNNGQATTLHDGMKNPPYRGSLQAPTHQLANNGSALRIQLVTQAGVNRYRVVVGVRDPEPDRVYVVGEYQLVGSGQWFPIDVVGGGNRVGPISIGSNGEGAALFEWDTTRLPIDRRDVVLRLRAVELPRRIGIIQHSTSVTRTIGQILPSRPNITLSASSLSFPTISVGDSASLDVNVANTGNQDLVISAIDLPSPEMRTSAIVPLLLAPGATQSVTVYVEPRNATGISGALRFASNDPVRPEASVQITASFRALAMTTSLLDPAVEVPLGEPVALVVVPAPDAHIERASVFYRSVGAPAFLDSTELRLLTGQFTGFVGAIPGRAVTEAGLQYYVRAENSGVFATDPAGAPASAFTQAVKPPTTVSSVPVPTFGDGFIEDSGIPVQVVLPTGARFVDGKLHVRMSGETAFTATDIVTAVPLPVGTIPDSVVSARGVEYWVEIQTETRSLTDPAIDPQRHPRSLPVTIVNLREPNRYAEETFRLLSVPLKMQGTIAGTLTDDIGGPDRNRWRMFAHSSASGSYVEIPDPNDVLTEFEQGRGYWLITRATHRIDTGPDRGVTAPTDRPFEIDLQPGYNLIGTPFNFAVPWDSCRIDTLSISAGADTLVEGPIGWSAGRGYVHDLPALLPFDGYWVRNRTTSPVVLKVPAIEVPPASSEPAISLRANDEAPSWWISVRASSGGQETSDAALGIHAGARAAWDSYDRTSPPMHPGDYVTVYFPHGGWRRDAGSYARDMRGDWEALEDGRVWGQAWHFDAAKSFTREVAGDEVTLEFSGVESVPADAHVVLVDRRLERLVDLRADRRYTFYQGVRPFVQSEDDARFALLVGSAEFVAREGSPMASAPTRTALYQNRPNPFNPTTIIRYELSTRGRVDVRIYDVSGALVRVLEDRDREPGVYEIGWDGDNDRGERVASGVYLYRMSAPGFQQTKKMVLLK